jgi:hypothetical protein
MHIWVNKDRKPPEYRVRARGRVRVPNRQEEEGIGKILDDFWARIEGFLDGCVEAEIVNDIADLAGRVKAQVM